MPRSEGGSAIDQPTTDQPSETDRVLEQRQGERGGQSATTTKTYTVKAGDTASGIAEEAGMDLETLMELNPELDPASLSPGQKIRLEE